MVILRFDGRDRLSRHLATIRERSGNLTPVLRQCGEIMQSSIEENFLSGGRFASAGTWRGGNSRWADLAPSTKAARAKKGKWPGKILQVSGNFAARISYTVTGNDLTIGSNHPAARIHQLGGKAGRGHKSNIPARPYLVIQDIDIDDMVDVAKTHIMKG